MSTSTVSHTDERLSPAQARALAARLSLPAALYDTGARFLWVNAACAALNRMPAGAHAGRAVADVAPLLAEPITRAVRQVAATGGGLRAVDLGAAAGGHWKVDFVPLFDGDALTAVGAFGVTDGADARAAGALRVAESRLAALLDNAPLGIVEWDREFHITRWGGEAPAIFGWQASEMLGRALADSGLVFADDERLVADAMRRLREPGTRQVVAHHRNRTRSGRVVHCEWYFSVVADSAGRPGSVLSLVLDVTERIRAQSELRAAAEQKDAFIATLAHELRNPLAPLRNAAYLLRASVEAGGAGASPQVSAIIERQVAHLAHLLDDLLDVSRLARGRMQLERSRVHLQAALRAAVEQVDPLVERRRQTLIVNLPPTAVFVDGDAARLTQMVANLLDNAAKFTGEGGVVRLALGIESGFAMVSVSDSGIGIAEADLPHVFDTFSSRQQAVSGRTPGLGLGLALVRSLALAHGGSVEAASPGSGQGATFTLRLPVANDDQRATRAQDEAGTARSTGPMDVLVVDDNRDNAETLAALLAMIGHRVQTAHTGQAALATAVGRRFDAAFLDIGLPDIDGYELARGLRARDPAMYLVAQTGFSQSRDRERARAAGFDELITKPFKLPDVTRALARAAEPRRTRD